MLFSSLNQQENLKLVKERKSIKVFLYETLSMIVRKHKHTQPSFRYKIYITQKSKKFIHLWFLFNNSNVILLKTHFI